MPLPASLLRLPSSHQRQQEPGLHCAVYHRRVPCQCETYPGYPVGLFRCQLSNSSQNGTDTKVSWGRGGERRGTKRAIGGVGGVADWAHSREGRCGNQPSIISCQAWAWSGAHRRTAHADVDRVGAVVDRGPFTRARDSCGRSHGN
jgi:hypothetical protein